MSAENKMPAAPHVVIDVHSHMLCPEWLELLQKRGAPRVTVKRIASGASAAEKAALFEGTAARIYRVP